MSDRGTVYCYRIVLSTGYTRFGFVDSKEREYDITCFKRIECEHSVGMTILFLNEIMEQHD